MADIKRDEKGLIPANAKDTTQKESNQRAKYTTPRPQDGGRGPSPE